MTIQEYQGLAMRTSPEGHDRRMNGCLGLIGESGEIVDAIKKWRFQSGENAEFPADALIKECGDVLWYCAELATGLGLELAPLYERYQEDFSIDFHALNEAAPVELLAYRIAAIATKPCEWLYDMLEPGTPKEWMEANAKVNLVGIMVQVRELLELHCGSTLEDAMEKNIEKLRRRYPDGFDPERSLHRTE